MVGAPAAAEAVELARRLPTLAVGLHLALVDAEPVLPPSAVPDLVDEHGRFRTNMALSGATMFFLPHVRRQMRAEIRAQFEAFRATASSLITSPPTSIFTCTLRFCRQSSSWRRNSGRRRFARHSSFARSSRKSRRQVRLFLPWRTRSLLAFSARASNGQGSPRPIRFLA